MKRILYAAAVLAVISGTSCTKEEQNVAVAPEDQQQETVTLEVSVPVIESKATTASNEDAVSSLQVFVFKTDGTLDGYNSGTSKTLTVSCTTGSRDVVAVVNAPSLSTITTKSALQSELSELSDNSLGSYVMYGAATKTVSTSTSITIEVARLVARVSIAKITNGITMDQYKNSVSLQAIYLINVAGDVVYPGGSTPSTWYNKRESNGDMSTLIESGTINSTIAAGASYSTAHYFYCYPNPTSSDTSVSTWSARYTRLVVEMKIGGTTYYYPISIAGIESNHTYEITNLTITRLGSDDPDVPVSTGAATFTITVTDWTTGSSLDYTI